MSESTIAQKLAVLKDESYVVLAKVDPCGALQARRRRSGAINFYWRYSFGKLSKRELIGPYDRNAPPKSLSPSARGYSIAAAKRAAEDSAQKHYLTRETGGRPAMLAAEAKARIEAEAAQTLAQQQTLAHLMDDYCNYLESQVRISHREARSIFRLHVIEAWPSFSAKQARMLSVEDVADMMRRLVTMGKGRTANKLRSYLGAAFQTAKASRSKGGIPAHFKLYDVQSNPAAESFADESFNRSAKLPLDARQMRAYWHSIKDAPGVKGAVLRLHLLTGGQRIAQFVRLLSTNIALDSILIFDGKGRPGRDARRHSVPLIPVAQLSLTQCMSGGTFAISTDGGETHIAGTTLSNWAVEAASTVDGIKNFNAKRIRSGVETLLASLGVSADVRGRIQSHGVSGVQSRHYDAYDYMREKRAALMELLNALNSVSDE